MKSITSPSRSSANATDFSRYDQALGHREAARVDLLRRGFAG